MSSSLQPDPTRSAAARGRWIANAEGQVRRAGLRTGPVRTAVLELLGQDDQCLLTAHDITRRLREQGLGSPASVYRVLDELYALGVLRRVDGRGGVARFEALDPERHHHHVVNDDTGEVTAFADDELETLIATVAARLGLRLTSHEVVLRVRTPRLRAVGDTYPDPALGRPRHDDFAGFGRRRPQPLAP